MIYRQSNDPVLLKKINISVWLLRDQLEQIIISRLNNNPDIKKFDDLIEEFSQNSKPNLRLLKFENENDEQISEDQEINEDESKFNNNNQEKTKADKDQIEKDDEPIKDKKEVIVQRLPSLPAEKVHHGRTFLSEIYMDKMLFFSDKQFIEGQSIVIQFNIPEKFILNAEVLYSQSYSLKNRIISPLNTPFRICVQFTFLKSGERTLLRKFLENIEYRSEEEIMASEKSEKANDNQTESSDSMEKDETGKQASSILNPETVNDEVSNAENTAPNKLDDSNEESA